MFRLVLVCLFVVTSAACPPKSLISPCGCRQSKMLDSLPDIVCDAKKASLRNLIQNLSSNQTVVNFGQLLWSQGETIELGDFFFGNLTFEDVNLGTSEAFSYISKVHDQAFAGPISDKIKRLQIRSYELKNDDSLYRSLRVLKNLEHLTIEGRYLQYIPSYAFSSKDGQVVFPNLNTISFNAGLYETLIFVTKIYDHAFYNLPSLTEINLNQQDVDYVGDFAFGLREKSNTTLVINLSRQWNTNLTSESFSLNAFETNRPVELDLRGDFNIEYLPERIFRPFLEADDRNKIHLNSPVECECEMYWIYRNKDDYVGQFESWSFDDDTHKGRIFQIFCKNLDDDLWNANDEDFASCIQNSQSSSRIISDEL